MWNRILGLTVISSAAFLLGACTNMTQYEKQVQDWEPVYCYKSIGAVQCYKQPKQSDSRRLVNFYGPAPSTYDKPDEPDYVAPKAPKMIDYWVKDPEPVPQANPPRQRVQTQAPLKAEPASLTREETTASPVNEDVSLMDGLLRSVFGKPQLANKPVATASAPLQPAPAAQPVIAVQSGTL